MSEQRDGLKLFVGFREVALAQEEVTASFNDIQHRHEARFVIVERGLEGGDGFLDQGAVLPCGTFLGCRTNEAIGEDGLDEQEDLLAGGLRTHQTANRLTFASPLSIPVRIGRSHQLSDLLPGRSWMLSHECVQVRPQSRQGSINNRA